MNRHDLTSQERKDRPIVSGVLDYFPDALLEVALCSKLGNDKHNPGEPLHWSREKSADHADCIGRHLLDRGKRDSEGVRHSAHLAWRALALLQLELEAEEEERGESPAAATTWPGSAPAPSWWASATAVVGPIRLASATTVPYDWDPAVGRDDEGDVWVYHRDGYVCCIAHDASLSDALEDLE